MNKRILLIEDNAQNRYLARFLLDARGWQVIEAEDGPSGLLLADRTEPAIILLDIQLPGMDGYEVLRRLREAAATRRTPVVALTANAMPQDLARGRAAGFDDYLTKPVMLPDLLAVVRRALRG